MTSLVNTSPPKLTARIRFQTVASIPHKTTAHMYLNDKDQPDYAENKYQARPPATVHPFNPNVAPTSYDPQVGPSKAAASTACKDTFGKSEVTRKL